MCCLGATGGNEAVLQQTQIKVEIFRSHQHGSRRFMQMDVGQSYTFSIIVRVSL